MAGPAGRMFAVVSLAAFGATPVHGDFLYVDFNKTTGLVLNGDAGTSNCVLVDDNLYSERYTSADETDWNLNPVHEEASLHLISDTVETNQRENTEDSDEVRFHAVFGQRDHFIASPQTLCPVRVRLTPSKPFQKGSVWYGNPVVVMGGFETQFTFQMSDLSRSCSTVRDRDFSTRHHKSCKVHGGDGLAFVLHTHVNQSATLGQGGGDMGYGGIENSIVVEFDTWYNADEDDFLDDHVSVQIGSLEPNGAGQKHRVVNPRAYPLADGDVHVARVSYFPEVKYEYVPFMTATRNLTPMLKDLAENRRLGTLVVWIDDGVPSGAADIGTPLLALPINLAVALPLVQGSAFVGFTSATGNSWEKHDLLSWYFCEEPPCSRETTFEFDYATQSQFSTAAHGHATTDAHYTFPDSSPLGIPRQHHAPDRHEGISE